MEAVASPVEASNTTLKCVRWVCGCCNLFNAGWILHNGIRGSPVVCVWGGFTPRRTLPHGVTLPPSPMQGDFRLANLYIFDTWTM